MLLDEPPQIGFMLRIPELTLDERGGEIGTGDDRLRTEPGAAFRPAADVWRVEKVLAHSRCPLGQKQRARRRVEKLQCTNSADGPFNWAIDSVVESRAAEKQLRTEHGFDGPA